MTLKIEVDVKDGESPAVVAQFLRETAERLEGTSAVAVEQERMGFKGGPVAIVSKNKGKIGFRKQLG